MTETVRAPDREQRKWYSAPVAAPVKGVTVCLVDAPISFGHSQLVVQFFEHHPEEDAFTIAAQHIAKCIRAFRHVLPDAISSYGQLAGYTDTTGTYLKTAILSERERNPSRIQGSPRSAF